MIRIERPDEIPPALAAGAALAAATSATHDADPALYATRKGVLPFDQGVYGDGQVRASLKQAQHYKCCFCESKIEHVSYGEVEHFRPKAAWRDGPGTRLTRPGYHWLAYEWTNLLWSCKICNGRYKGNTFPLLDPATRDCVGRSLANEQPMLIDPTATEPRDHIRFKLEVAVPLTPEGASTIDTLGLNREMLLEHRRARLNELTQCRRNIEFAERLGELDRVTDAVRTLEHAVLPRSPYSSMAMDLLADLASTAPAGHAAPVP